MDDFVISFSQDLNQKDFVSKDESVSKSRRGKRQYLKDSLTRSIMGAVSYTHLTLPTTPYV